MSTFDKFGTARFLDPASAQLGGQQRVNAEIFMAMEILGRKLERSETERDRLTRRLTLIESAATVDEKTGKLYLPMVMDPALGKRDVAQNSSQWLVVSVLMSSSIALFALGLVLFQEPPSPLTKEQMVVLDKLKTTQFSLATIESNAWKRPEASVQLPDTTELDRQERVAEMPKPVDMPAVASVPSRSETKSETSAEEQASSDIQPAEKVLAPVSLKTVTRAPTVVATVAADTDAELSPDASLPEKLSQLETRAYQGIPEAQHDMATLYASGKLVAQDYRRAIYWFRKSADGGIANAHYNLGVMYQQGLGVRPDIPKSLGWYEKAAELGHPEAMYNLGIAYIEGIGATANLKKGVSYLKRAASTGMAQAAYNLGVIYESNFIGAIDMNKALEWYRAAANAGHTEARTSVSRLSGSTDQALTLADQVEPAAGKKYSGDSTSIILSKVQQELARQGLLSGNADGLMTPQTEDAIRARQKNLGLQEDGQASQALLDKLFQSVSASQ